MAAPLSWSAELRTLYESHAAGQFILHGNVEDRVLIPANGGSRLGSVEEYLLEVLLPGFDVVLTYDLGNGVRVARGGRVFTKWPSWKEGEPLPKKPREAIELLTHYLRYCANLQRIKGETIRVAVIMRAAHLVIPALPGALNYDLNAMALLVREWASDPLLTDHPLATFLIAENLNDLHPLLVNHPRVARLRLPLPPAEEMTAAFRTMAPRFPTALKNYTADPTSAARRLAGATLSSTEALLKRKDHLKEPLTEADLSALKKELVEKDCSGLIEFIESAKTLDDVHGQDTVKKWLRQDMTLWRQDDLEAMPMGYLLCGPVGTGKTYVVNCLAGEAGVPVVRFKNFRDKWVGSTEGNLEKIFRLLQALGRCVVFIDEADQALGSREGGSGDSGVSGRVYSMMAEEMSNPRNRGRILWVLASSRPDLIEVDLKRPGRIDVKIPLFPATTPEECFQLLSALGKRQRVPLEPADFDALKPILPTLVTPGAAESLAIKAYRFLKTGAATPSAAWHDALEDYQNPVPPDIMRFQIDLAVREASDLSFVPAVFRKEV